jgi:hypothetical protein
LSANMIEQGCAAHGDWFYRLWCRVTHTFTWPR